MNTDSSLPLGVCVLPEPGPNRARSVTYPDYVHEILAHAGVCYRAVPFAALGEELQGLRLLLTVGETPFPEELRARLRAWVRAGGGWVSVGGVCGMEDTLGAEPETPAYTSWGGGISTLGEGYLLPLPGEPTRSVDTRSRLREFRAASDEASLGERAEPGGVVGEEGIARHPLLAHLDHPLHFFNGLPVQARGATALASVLDAHQRPTTRQAVLEHAAGKGRCLLLAPDVTGAVVRIQQGVAITRDGVPAPDGTAPVSDGVLKSGDGGALDWAFDRQPVPDAPGLNAFLQPIADQWRELLLRAVFTLADALDVPLPVLWLYPRRLPAVGHLSHDTDGNEPEKAHLLLAALDKAQVRSTWCVILPGYAPELLAAIRAAGHELAAHYDAMSPGCAWGEAEFDAQWQRLCALLAPDVPVTNKNHYLRWEGDTEFFAWCARRGIRLDQSKGASKTGEAGFNFGTCHPYFPVAPGGETLDVLELPTPTQDLNVFAPEALTGPLLEATARHHGVLHLLFHPAHMDKPGVADALVRAVERGRERGLEWWTARQLDAWERARRQARWESYRREADSVRVTLRAGGSLPDATLLWLCRRPGALAVNGEAHPTVPVTCWGFPFHAAAFSVPERSGMTVQYAWADP